MASQAIILVPHHEVYDVAPTFCNQSMKSENPAASANFNAYIAAIIYLDDMYLVSFLHLSPAKDVEIIQIKLHKTSQ